MAEHSNEQIDYPDYVEEIDAIEAVRKYKPDTVLASYLVDKRHVDPEYNITLGLDGEELLKHCKRYIHIGNLEIHGSDPLLKRPHKELKLDGLITIKQDSETDRIFIWGR